MHIIQSYKKYIKSKKLKAMERHVRLDNNSFFSDSFSVDLRNPVKNQIYLTIGSHCIVEGNFIFETETGEILVGDRCHIGNSSFISRSRITIGSDVTIAWGCTIYDHNSHSTSWMERRKDTEQEYFDIQEFGNSIQNKDWSCVITKPIIIKDKVWIGLGVIILKGVTVGEGAVVAAGSVVTKDVPPWTVVAGNPAQVVKILEHQG